MHNLITDGAQISSASDTSASSGVEITSGAANTKGSWVEMWASTPFGFTDFHFTASKQTTGASLLFDVGIGGAGSEQVLVSDILFEVYNADECSVRGYVPIKIPAGVRVAVRSQSSSASYVSNVNIVGFGTGTMAGSACGISDTYGADLVNSVGTPIDPGGTINTYGSWTEITASTTRDHRGLLINLGDNNNNVQSTEQSMFQLGVGGAGSEQIVLSDICNLKHNSENAVGLPFYDIPIAIPKGTRLSMRRRSNVTDATDRITTAIIIGFS